MSRPVGPVEPTAKQRLQATRQALMHELMPSTRAASPRPVSIAHQVPGHLSREALASDERSYEEQAHAEGETQHPDDLRSAGAGWFAIARHSVRAWWEFHPVRVVGVVAEPVLAEYARQRPLKLMGIAAGVGALVVITRPWRLVSLGGLAVAALKSSQVSNFALSFLSKRNNNRNTR